MQLVSREVVEYIGNRKEGQNRGVCFSFWYKPDGVVDTGPDKGEKNKARAEIDYYDGSWHTVANGTVTPVNATEWHMAQVSCRLPPTPTQARVRIRGYPYSGEGFKAWIDRASLSVCYYNTASDSTYGDVALVTSVYHSQATQIPEFDGFVSAGVSVAAKAKGSYSIYRIRDLKVELLPNNGIATTQQGRLVILYFQQKNNKEFKLDPRTSQELINSATATGQLAWSAIWIAADVTFTVAVFPYTGAKVLALSIVWDIGGGVLSSLPFVAEKVHNPLAEGGSSHNIWETLNYWEKMGDQTDRVEYAGAEYCFDWRFRTDSDDVFAIRVSATVEWGAWDGYGDWYKVSETPVCMVISMASYWR